MHWSASPDTSLNVTLPEDLPGVLSAPVARLAISADKQVEKKALVALEWMERAYLSGDRLVKMLYLFFALESLLGDTQEGLKSHMLAYRQMMLSHIVTGGFENPDSTLDMYVKIRNAAVHGEDLPDVSQGVVGYFEWSVRDALNQYLELAEREGFRSRSQLTRFLDTHADRPQLFDWLRQHGDREWAAYLDKDESAAVCTPDGSEATSDEESRPQDKEASGEAERKPGNSSAAQHCGN